MSKKARTTPTRRLRTAVRRIEKAVATRETAPANEAAQVPEPAAPTSDMALVAKAAANLAIVTVRCVLIHGTTSNRAFVELPRDVEADISFTRPSLTTREEALSIETTFTFRLQPEADPGTPIAEVRAVTELVYSKKPGADLSEAELRAFAEVNAPFNAWPYWRELTQSLLGRLGLPALPLPLFRVADVPHLMREP